MILPDFLSEDELGSIRLSGHRIGLMHLVHLYNDGYSPEELLCEYPTLSLALIHKVIAFYLENQAEVDQYISRCEGEIESQRASARNSPNLNELRQRLRTMRRASATFHDS